MTWHVEYRAQHPGVDPLHWNSGNTYESLTYRLRNAGVKPSYDIRDEALIAVVKLRLLDPEVIEVRIVEDES